MIETELERPAQHILSQERRPRDAGNPRPGVRPLAIATTLAAPAPADRA